MAEIKGIGGHQSHNMQKDEWLTPPHIFKALGEFDLDPCAPHPDVRPWDTAKNHFCKEDDGLSQDWFGRVWLNPPYGRDTEKWIKKLAKHGNGIALIFARTETSIFFPWVWDYADSIMFIHKRLHFYNVNGVVAKNNSGAPSCLIAYGQNNTEALTKAKINGKLLKVK